MKNVVAANAPRMSQITSSALTLQGMKMLNLRGPVAILSISRDFCSDSIAKLSRACFCWGGGGIAQISRDMLQTGVSHRCACSRTSQCPFSQWAVFQRIFERQTDHYRLWATGVVRKWGRTGLTDFNRILPFRPCQGTACTLRA